MGFKILVRTASNEFAKAMAVLFEEQTLVLDIEPGLDWACERSMGEYFRGKPPSVAVNFASHFAHLSQAEQQVERQCLQALTAACAQANTPLLHFSSFRVFGQSNDGNELKEAQVPTPDDDFGRYLHDCERICQRLPRHMILRLGWMLDGEYGNVLHDVVERLLGEQTFAVSDQAYGRPVTMKGVANTVLAMAQQIVCGADNWGVFHLRSADKCSEAELCDVLVRLLNAEFKPRRIAMPTVVSAGDPHRLYVGNAMLAGARCTDNFGVQCVSWRKGIKSHTLRYLAAQGHKV